MTEEQKREIIDKCKSTTRGGLYIMVIIILLKSCDYDRTTPKLESIEKHLERIENVITNTLNTGLDR